MAPVPARQCAWMHRMCHTHTQKKHGATNQQQTSLTKHQLPSKFCLLKVHLVRRLCVCVWGWARASVRSRSIYQQHARERRLLLRIPHSGCPAAARPNMNTQVRQRQRPAESRNRSDEPTGRLFFFFFFSIFLSEVSRGQTTSHPGVSTRRWEREGERERWQAAQSWVQMCSQDVLRDWVFNPSSPPLPFPLADDNTAANTDHPPTTTTTHTHNAATVSPPSSHFTLSTGQCDMFKCCWKIHKCRRHKADNEPWKKGEALLVAQPWDKTASVNKNGTGLYCWEVGSYHLAQGNNQDFTGPVSTSSAPLQLRTFGANTW